tara:strand:+ start:173 stop:1945 length:1773 start_codon:yes stop_codon:yes gene_type:complete
MKILRLLSKKIFLIFFIIFFKLASFAEDKPVDIWDLDKKELDKNSGITNVGEKEINNNKIDNESDIFSLQSQKKESTIELGEILDSETVKLYGLYDPEDYSLDIDMWANSDGDQIKSIFSKLKKLNLSTDAKEIMKISLLTNAHPPKKNISESQFFKYKSDWLIKNSDLELIEEYLIKNQIFDVHPNLVKYLLDEYLSDSNLKKACEILFKNTNPINDKYISKFNIYCLIDSGKKDEAQLIYDLKKELGFKDKYFESKINYLIGFDSNIDNKISEKSILDFHLAHRTNPNFTFEPKINTNKLIWKYLSSANLLSSAKQIEITDIEKISIIEKATHNKNYPEQDLFEIYKRFQFNINQLLNVELTHKSLKNIEARALIYQKILLESEVVEKLKLLKLLKDSFKNEDIGEAFDIELKKFLEKIDPAEVPDNLTSFYYTNINIKQNKNDKIKFDNDVLHQSKLINYFNGDYSDAKIKKEINSFLKKMKKNKKYSFSKKDQIFLESLQSDGIEISKKFDDLYEINQSEIPTDIQVMINNNEKGMALLRIAEVIGQDKIDRIDEDTIYFIISTLNQLNIDFLRNQILLKVLPLKV